MLNALKNLFDAPAPARPELERRQLMLAVAGLLHEMTRVDLESRPEEMRAAEAALRALFDCPAAEAADLLAEGSAAARRYTSYFGAVSVVKRWYGPAERAELVEHLWRIAYAHSPLDPHEDHFVRKIAHLLYVPNTEAMLARARARGG